MPDESATTSLAETQAALARALSSPPAPWPPELLAGVVPGGTLDAAGALAVYRSGYVARLTDQLGETYRTVWRVVGDDTFVRLCALYIDAHPSTSYNLSDYGRGFARFLERAGESGAAPALPAFAPELARFELEFHDLFHAADHEPVDARALAAVGDLTGVRLRFGSAVRWFSGDFAVYDLFRHRRDEHAPDVDVERPQRVLMYRHRGDVLAQELDEATFVALETLAEGVAVDDALARAARRDEEFGAEQVQRLFELIGRCGLVVGWER